MSNPEPSPPGDRWSRWMGALAADFRLVMVLLAAGLLARIAMLWWQHGTFAAATGWGDIAESALSGLRLDMQVAAALAAVSAALGLLHLFWSREPAWLGSVRRNLRAGILLVMVAILPLLTAIDLAYLGEYGRRFDNTLFSAGNDDVGAIVRTIWHNWPVLPILAVTLPIGAGLAWLGLRFSRPRCEAPVWLDRQSLGSRFAITLVAVVLAVLFAHGSLGRTPWNMGVACLGADPRLDQLVPSTLKALHRAWIDHRHITRSNGILSFIPDGDIRAAAVRWAGHDAGDLDDLTARAAAGGRPTPPRHVLLVVLESYGAWALDDAWRPLGLTEGMRRLGNEGTLLTRFTSGADFTMKSFGSIVAGLPYAGLELPYLPASHTPFPTSLPAAFKRLGYRTRFFYAGYASWQQIDTFVRDQGFDESYCGGTLGLDPRRHNEWGLPDVEFFPAVLDRLDDSAPSLTVVLSVGNHEPFDVDVHAAGFPLHTPPLATASRCDESFDAKVLGHFWLMDREFIRFVRTAGKRLPGLLVAATGDHFGRRFPNRRPSLAERTLVPLLLWGPGLDRQFPPNQAGSHLDIAPTLIERCAPAGFAYHSFGRDLLAPVPEACGIGYTVVVTPDAVVDMAGPEQDGCTAAVATCWRRLADDERALGWWRARNGAIWPATLKIKESSRRRRPGGRRKVLLVDSEMGWRGGQQQVLLLAQGLATHPCFTGEAITVCRPGSQLAARLAQAGLPRAELDMRSPWSPRAVCGLRRLADHLGADVLHAHASHAHTLCTLASFASPLHLVATRRVDFAPKGVWKYRRCTRVVAISRAIAGILANRGVPPDRIDLIPSGIDPERFAMADHTRGRAALGLGPTDRAVLCVAALEGHKDHGTLLAAWSRIAMAHPTAHLLLAGDGSLRAALAETAATLPRVRLLGFRDDIPDLLAAAHAFTLTSHLEGLGTAVMDAMCWRLPVVATRAGGIPELIAHGEDGLLVPIGDATAVSDALGRVLSDASLRMRLGTAARATATRRFLASEMVASYIERYDHATRGI